MATADLGENTDKFAQRMKKQQEAKAEVPMGEDSARNNKSTESKGPVEDVLDVDYSLAVSKGYDEELLKGVDTSGMTDREIQEFVKRKKELQSKPTQNDQTVSTNNGSVANILAGTAEKTGPVLLEQTSNVVVMKEAQVDVTKLGDVVAKKNVLPPVARPADSVEKSQTLQPTKPPPLPARKSSKDIDDEEASAAVLFTKKEGWNDQPTEVKADQPTSVSPQVPNTAAETKLEAAAGLAQPPKLSLNIKEEMKGITFFTKSPATLTYSPFQRLPIDTVLRCRITRRKNLLDKATPTFLLHMEHEDRFVLAAKKKLISTSVYYVISDSAETIQTDSPHYLAKLKGNFKRTRFVLKDQRSSGVQQELACVNYSKNVLPRVLHLAITNADLPEDAPTGKSTNIEADFKANDPSKLFFMKNVSPRWNETTQSHYLNFGGRVTQPSIKNMQIVSELDENYIVMQFGRCGTDVFTLDARWPITPIEAFGIALSTFDAYDNA